MPRKVFVSGEILTAADVNTYLADQAVMTFADATARTAAIPTPSEGMVTYLEDTNKLYVYTTSWEEVLAGSGTFSGITGVGTLNAGAISSGFGNINIGTSTFTGNGSGLTTLNASNVSSGTLNSARLPAGTILQVVSATKTDVFTTTSTTFSDVSGLSVSITPRATSSKILVLFNGQMQGRETIAGPHVKVLRGSTDIAVGNAAGSRTRAIGMYELGVASMIASSISHLDSPSTTSATTYKVQVRSNVSGQAVYMNRTHTDVDSASFARGASSLTVLEVAG